MLCDPQYVVDMINEISNNPYELKMVLMSIANTNPDLVLQAMYKIHGERKGFQEGLYKAFDEGGRVEAAKYYMERTGQPLPEVVKCLDKIFEREKNERNN